ncbi:MAG: hypothetical protein ACJ76Y_11730 [Thermoanaerobaculia bacterium]
MDLLKELLKTGIPPAIWAFMLYRLARHLVEKFQTPFEQIAQRIKRIGPAEFESALTQATEAARELSTSSPPAELGEEDQSLLGNFRSAINEWLQHVPDDRRQTELINLLANWQIGWWLEVTNFFVLGGQIALLQVLNSQPVSSARAREFYDEAAACFPDVYDSYSFDQWLAWLRDTAQLVSQSPDGSLAITELGREFLKYLIHRGYSFSRFG